MECTNAHAFQSRPAGRRRRFDRCPIRHGRAADVAAADGGILQTHPQDPQCNLSGGQGQGTGHNQGHQPGTNPNPPAGSPPPPTPGAGPNNGPSLSFNFSSGDRSQFHNRFRGLNFGTFGVPGFSISIGTTVPHSYGLKPVPRTIYKYYPQFRGYLFFVGRHGDFVIVSPRSYRVVAVL